MSTAQPVPDASKPAVPAASKPTVPAAFRPSAPDSDAVPAAMRPAAPAAAASSSSSSSSSSAPSTSAGSQSAYTVRMQKNTKKKFNIMKFKGTPVDFGKIGTVKMERENNYKDFKLAHDVDLLPKFGAGSEFGRQQKDEARRKKYGMATRRYNPYAQPWLMRAGSGKAMRKFKGTKEGGITENTSYFVFTQCSDGAFEACPVDEWYSFNPTIKYKFLNSEEAEEEFSKREKNLNLRTIMLKKRLKGEDALDEEEEAELKGKKKKKGNSSGLKLTEMEDWADDSDDSADASEGEGNDAAEKKKKAKQKPKKKHKRGGKANSDEEAIEESDDANEGAEVDYMTSSDSEEELMFEPGKQRENDKYEEKGVEEEKGLLMLIDSAAEDDSDEEKKEEEPEEEDEEEEEGKKDKEKKSKKNGNGSDSDSSSSSDSDSDADEPNVHSALFLGPKKAEKAAEKADKAERKKQKRRPSLSSEGSATNSRSATPAVDPCEDNCKRSATASPVLKKPRMDAGSSSSSNPGAAEGITDEAVRRYLMRKPMTTKDILGKFKSKKTGLSNDQIVHAITQVLKRLNPEKQKVKEKLYLFIKKTS